MKWRIKEWKKEGKICPKMRLMSIRKKYGPRNGTATWRLKVRWTLMVPHKQTNKQIVFQTIGHSLFLWTSTRTIRFCNFCSKVECLITLSKHNSLNNMFEVGIQIISFEKKKFDQISFYRWETFRSLYFGWSLIFYD